MTEFVIEDIELKSTDKKSLELSVQLSMNGLSYAYYHRESNKYLGLCHIPSANDTAKQIDYLASHDIIFNNSYSKIRVIYSTPECTIIPAALFNENDIDRIFGFSFRSVKNQKALASHLPQSGNFVIYGIPEKLYDFLFYKFSDKSLFVQSAPFIDCGITRHLLDNEKPLHKIYVDVFSDFFEAMLLENDKLLLYNTFKYKSPNDLVYYLLSIFNQFKLDQSKTHICFSGFLEKDNIAVIQLRKFVQYVYFESRNTHFNYCYKFQEIQSHVFFNLLNLVECG